MACDPLALPAFGLEWVASRATETSLPLVRETGRLVGASATLLRAPPLFVESLVTLDAGRGVGAMESLCAGTGGIATATWNVPFFWLPGRSIDLARDVEGVNSALTHLEQHAAVFPPGTRARAAGKLLVYDLPGYGQIHQAAESNAIWAFLQYVSGTEFVAQERSWGFVVDSRATWDARPDRTRTVTILHELFHQHAQMRERFHGWTAIYWPSYIATFLFTGWDEHWAETGSNGATRVDEGLRTWPGANR
ncbi:MAG: hypothetical protein ACKVX7_08920 [Planctomycetota bacterium]